MHEEKQEINTKPARTLAEDSEDISSWSKDEQGINLMSSLAVIRICQAGTQSRISLRPISIIFPY